MFQDELTNQIADVLQKFNCLIANAQAMAKCPQNASRSAYYSGMQLGLEVARDEMVKLLSSELNCRYSQVAMPQPETN